MKHALSQQEKDVIIQGLHALLKQQIKLSFQKKMKLFCYYIIKGMNKKLLFYINPRTNEVIFGIGHRGTDILEKYLILPSLADETKQSVIKFSIKKIEDIEKKSNQENNRNNSQRLQYRRIIYPGFHRREKYLYASKQNHIHIKKKAHHGKRNQKKQKNIQIEYLEGKEKRILDRMYYTLYININRHLVCTSDYPKSRARNTYILSNKIIGHNLWKCNHHHAWTTNSIRTETLVYRNRAVHYR